MRLSASVEDLRIDGADHDGGDAGGHEVVHQALLHGGGGLLGIFQLQVVVRQFVLRLLHAGLGELPEVGRAVDDEGELFLVLRHAPVVSNAAVTSNALASLSLMDSPFGRSTKGNTPTVEAGSGQGKYPLTQTRQRALQRTFSICENQFPASG